MATKAHVKWGGSAATLLRMLVTARRGRSLAHVKLAWSGCRRVDKMPSSLRISTEGARSLLSRCSSSVPSMAASRGRPLTSWVRFRFGPLSGVAVARPESRIIPAQRPHSARPRYHPSQLTKGQFQRVPWTNPWTRASISGQSRAPPLRVAPDRLLLIHGAQLRQWDCVSFRSEGVANDRLGPCRHPRSLP
jgi:hypothetical protein